MSDPLPPDLAAALRATAARRGCFGQTVYYFVQTGSTNDIAARLAERGAPEGTLIVAAAQSAGRGRLGRRWHSPPDAGLYASLVCRSVKAAPYLTLAGGVAVASGVRAATGLPVEIRWPNDIVVSSGRFPADTRKVAGILAEASSAADELQHVILGFGVNLRAAVYPPDLAGRATSIETELGRPVEAGPVLGEILAGLAASYSELAAGDPTRVLAQWRALAPGASGAQVECDTSKGRRHGVTAGMADDGALLVRVDGEVERVISGTVLWK